MPQRWNSYLMLGSGKATALQERENNMTKKYAKVSIEYIDYLIDISDAQSLLNILSRAERLSLIKDGYQDKYIPMRYGKANVIISLPKKEEVDAPVYIPPQEG